MVGQHHRLDGHKFEQALGVGDGHESEQTPGDSEGQGSLECCSSWGCKEPDMTQ